MEIMFFNVGHRADLDLHHYAISTLYFTDLNKLNLTYLDYGSLVLGLRLFSVVPKLSKQRRLLQKWSNLTQKSSCFASLKINIVN